MEWVRVANAYQRGRNCPMKRLTYIGASMNHLRTINLAVALIILGALTGCRKNSESPTWVTMSPSDIGFSSSTFGGFMAMDTSDGLYVIQWNPESDLTEYAYRPKGGNWIRHELLNYEKTLNHTTANDDDGTVWLLAEAYLYHMLDGEILRRYEISNPNTTYQYNAFRGVSVGGGRVWLLNKLSGLHELNLETGILTHYPDTSATGDYHRLAADDFGNVWVAKDSYYNGLMHLTSAGDWVYVDRSNPVFDCPSCYPNSENYYVFALRLEYTGDNRLYLLTRNTWHDFPYALWTVQDDSIVLLTEESLGAYSRLRSDPLGRPWIHGIQDGHFGVFENGMFTYISLSEAYQEPVYSIDMQFDSHQNVWVSTNKGIAVYNVNGVDL